MRKLSLVGVAGLFLFSLSACSSSSETSDSTIAVEAATYPVTVGDLTLETQPMRIVSLSPTATEMLYAIGAGTQVVAVDDYSNYPAEAAALGTMLSGFEPNVEAMYCSAKSGEIPALSRNGNANILFVSPVA